MRYRSQYISTLIKKENSEIPIFKKEKEDIFQSSRFNIESNKFIENIDILSEKIDIHFSETKNSINAIENRVSNIEVDFNFKKSIIDQSENKFQKKIESINYDIDNFLDNEINSQINKEAYKESCLNNSSLSYNKNWEEEFEGKGLSLEDDGIYEYEDGEEDMKYEYYTGELPKTKIVKVRANDGIQTYTKDDISSFIENESKKLALNEVSKLHNQSETTQKAWLANNQRLVELTNIIESQEKEIRRLSQNALNKSHVDQNDVSDIINNKALKIFKNEYDIRISALEKEAGISNNDGYKKLQEENEKLRNLISNKNQQVELIVSTPIIQEGPKIMTKFNNSDISGRKRKQKFFFEILEHSTPKITKADLEK